MVLQHYCTLQLSQIQLCAGDCMYTGSGHYEHTRERLEQQQRRCCIGFYIARGISVGTLAFYTSKLMSKYQELSSIAIPSNGKLACSLCHQEAIKIW